MTQKVPLQGISFTENAEKGMLTNLLISLQNYMIFSATPQSQSITKSSGTISLKVDLHSDPDNSSGNWS